ncbi:hypothetical protein IX308_001051 [Porphyromonas levii]|uniref:CRISPR-associated endoribonuclease Cas6 n=1 Tax=Porphyromonas levii TaxID=28114 RepID=UPI001BACC4C8|nr:CRISPR-associated endoribonuclease Cas6 [Porphyromonas levii]MBR8784863.1 hypothetical protein [Porphyromonas levii]
MRLQIEFKSNANRIIPFNHQPALVGVIHKWLGDNNPWHGKSSFFSFSRLNGGVAMKEKNALLFEHGAHMFFSACDIEIIRTVLVNLRYDPQAFSGLVVSDVVIIEDPDLSDREIFYPASPILLKERGINGDTRHVIYTDTDASRCLTEKFQAKLVAAGFDDPSAAISFVPTEGFNQTQLVSYKKVKNKGSWCPIRIVGKAESKLLAWNSGLGNSTGIGFGAIK